MIKNYAPDIEVDERNTLARSLVRSWRDCIDSRRGRITQIREIDRVFSLRTRPKTFPFTGCANIMMPLMTAPVIQHQSRLFDMIYAGGSKLATVYSPSDLGAAERAMAERYFNFYLMHEMPEMPLGLDVTTHQSTLFGSSFRRIYWDYDFERCVSDSIGLEDFVAPNKIRDTDPAMRQLPYYFVMKRMSLRQAQAKSTWVDTDQLKVATIQEPDGQTTGDKHDRGNSSAATNLDSPRLFVEAYFKWPTPDRPKKDASLDGRDHPAFAVIDIEQEKLHYLCLREEDDPRDQERFAEANQMFAEAQQVQGAAMQNHVRAVELFTSGEIPEMPEAPKLPKLTAPTMRKREVPMCVHYRAYPSDGFYGLGLGDFLLGAAKGTNTIVNQSIDASTVRIARPGFISNLAKGPRGIQSAQPGKFVGLDVPPDQLKSAVFYPDLPPGDPFMQYVIQIVSQGAQAITGSFETMSGDMPKSNQSAQGTMALIEEMRAPITVAAKRLKISFTEELTQIWRQLGMNLPDDMSTDILGFDGAVENVRVGRAMFSPSSRIYPTADSRPKSERQTDAMNQFSFAAQNPLVQVALKGGNRDAIQLLADLSATVFRAAGNEKAALAMQGLVPPPPAPPEEGAPPNGAGPPGPPEMQPQAGGAPPS